MQVAVGVLLMHCIDAHAVPSSWRTAISNAHIDIDNPDDCIRAINVYSEAIKSISKEEPQSEAKYDLYLNLAECYRRNKQLARCEKILDEVEPVILKGIWNDPLLQARYWRRRADLFYSQGKSEQYGKTFILVWKILQQNIPNGGKREFITPLVNLNRVHDWNTAVLVMEQIATMKQMDKRSREMNDAAIIGTCHHIRQDIIQWARNGRFEQAERFLCRMSPLDLDRAELLNAWIEFLALRPGSITQSSKAMIEKILQDTDTQNPHLKCLNLCLLGKTFEKSGDLFSALTKYEEANKLAREMSLRAGKDEPLILRINQMKNETATKLAKGTR